MPNFGFKHSEESRKKMSISRKGHIGWHRGKNISPTSVKKRPDLSIRNKSDAQRNAISNYNKKRIFTDATRIKIGIASSMGRKNENKWKNENNPSWKGGITPLLRKIRNFKKYSHWRKMILMRDNFVCVNCGLGENILHIHHVHSFAELIQEYQIKTLKQAINCDKLWDISNGITLCIDCHKNTDTYAINKKNENEEEYNGKENNTQKLY